MGHDHGHRRELPPGMIEQLELAYAAFCRSYRLPMEEVDAAS